MMTYAKQFLIVTAVLSAFFFGYSVAETEGDLKLSEQRDLWEKSNNEALRSIVKNYELELKTQNEKTQSLINDLAASRRSNADLVRKLNAFSSRDTDLATCRRERGELGEIAVGLDGVAREAISFARALKN